MKIQVFSLAPLVAALSVATTAVTADEMTPTNAPPKSFWERDTLTGDWGGVRTTLTDHGVDFSPAYTGEVLGNIAGGKYGTGAVYDHSLNLPLTVDLEKLAGWSGVTFHANAFWIAGESLSEKCVGDIGNVSNIAAEPAVRLQEFWLQQEFWQSKISLRAGQLAADSEFFAANSSALFVNGAFGAFPLIAANLPNPPVYPLAAPAVRLKLQPDPRFYFQAAIFAGDSGSQENNPSGINFRVASGDGALIFSEIGFLPRANQTNALATTLKAGSFVLTKRTPDWNTQISGSGGGAANFGFYGVAEQDLFQHDARKISAFLRGGCAPPSRNMVDWYFDAGINFTGLVSNRAQDVAGLAVSRSQFSDDFSRYSQVVNGESAHDSEIVVETTYRAQITPWWTVQPDAQFIVTPGGDRSCQNAFVIGLRTGIVF